MTRFEQCLLILTSPEIEGGYSNNKHDNGGMTNLGVTKKAYEEFLGREVTEKEMRNLTHDKVKEFYKKNYWDVNHCSELPVGLDLCVFDFGVNAGPGRSAKLLQRIVGALEDGDIGPKTLEKVKEYIKKKALLGLIQQFSIERMRYYKSLEDFQHFGKGWGNRTTKIESYATSHLANLA